MTRSVRIWHLAAVKGPLAARAPASALPPAGSLGGDLLAIARFHIVLIAMTACVTFGWLMTGRYAWALVPVVAVDWFVINLLNRITDIDEDLKNGIPGTTRVARQKRFFSGLAGVLVVGSFLTTHLLWPALTPFRAVVQAIGCGYSYRLVPTPSGLRRFKEIYFLKNFMSAVLFVLTCFVYPLVVFGASRTMSGAAIFTLVVFFVSFEITYEILYDLRDLEGDSDEGVPTYPVVHGIGGDITAHHRCAARGRHTGAAHRSRHEHARPPRRPDAGGPGGTALLLPTTLRAWPHDVRLHLAHPPRLARARALLGRQPRVAGGGAAGEHLSAVSLDRRGRAL